MSFAGLHIALSSLYTHQRAIELTGHNVANANTAGYTRQRAEMASFGGQTVPAIHAIWTRGGGGVGMEGVARLRDDFLEARALQEHGLEAALRRSQAVLARVELTFAEPGPTGLQSVLSEYWAGWGDVANRPEDLASRSQLLERARTVAASFNQSAGDLSRLWESSTERLEIAIADVNATAARVAELNGAIERATRAGLSPNDLADQRDALVLQLSNAIGVTVRSGGAGMVDVYVGGTALVRGSIAEALTVDRPAGTDITTVGAQPVVVRWAKDGYPASVMGGDTGGILDAINAALPTYRASLDAVAQQLAVQVNAQHASGVDLDGDPGGMLFSWSAAEGLHVVLTDPRKLAAAAPASGQLDGANALALAALASSPDGADAAYRTFIVGLGVDTQAVNRRVEIQANITDQIDGARESVAGVSIDEEMTNMIAFQHGYSAASRVLTAVDEMLDRLINHTGLVGR